MIEPETPDSTGSLLFLAPLWIRIIAVRITSNPSLLELVRRALMIILCTRASLFAINKYSSSEVVKRFVQPTPQ